MENKWYLSSTGSGDLSLTIKGIILSFAPLIILLGALKGITITAYGIEEIIAQFTLGVSSVVTFYGLLRKCVLFLKELYK